MLIAQITDMHLGERLEIGGRDIDPAARLAEVVAHINGLDPRPDFVIATGDLTADGRPEDYAQVAALLAGLAMPFTVIPGNHDERAALRAAFPDVPWSEPPGGFLQQAIALGPLRLIALDTVVPGEGHGALCAERLAWLEARLSEAPSEPTLIAMHHPPLAIGIPEFDEQSCRDGPALGTLLRGYDNVEAVICGHVHRPISVRWAGTVVHVSPSSSYQYALDFRDRPLLAADEPRALRLLTWMPESGLVSHLSPF